MLKEIRPEERRGAFAAFLTLFGTLAGHTLLETARDALFLARLPASQLPWVYLAIAALAVLVSQGPWRARRGMLRRHGVAVLLILCAAVTLGFYAFSSLARSAWTLRALYVWSGLVGTLTGLQFWLVLGELYTVTQAKRLFKFVSLGSLLGAVAGSALARALVAETDGAQTLVLASGLAFLATGLGPAVLMRRPDAPRERRGPGLLALRQSVQLVQRHPYLRGLGALVLISTVALTLGDYVFKSAVAREIPREHLGTFFANVSVALNSVALVFQLLLMGLLMRVLGLHRALFVLPSLLALGASGVAFGGGLVAALVLKGADGTFRYSLHRTTIELLFVPIPDSLRSRAKPLIDVVGQRGGQAIASLFILSEVLLHRGDIVLATLGGSLCVLWIALAADLRRHYLDLFRAALREGTIVDREDLPDLDLHSLEALFGALGSPHDTEVRGAMDLLAAQGRTRLIPALILYHPSRPVVLRALELFERSGRSDFVAIADRLLAQDDPELRAAALRARTMAAPDAKLLLSMREDQSPLVRATAVVGLVAHGFVADENQTMLDDILSTSGGESQMALARAIARNPSPLFEEALLRLADSPDEKVLRQVAVAMGALPSPRFLPALLAMLAQHRAREAARKAFLAYGPDGLEFLERSLADRTLPHEIRRHLPRTLSLFPEQAAADALLRRLVEEEDGMVRFKILRGLGRVASDHPELRLDERVLREATLLTLQACFRQISWRLTLHEAARVEPGRATTGHELLLSLLRDKETHAVERVFRLLGLLHRGEDFRQIHRGLRSQNSKVRAGSRELLENLLREPLRGPVLALVDDAPEAERLRTLEPAMRPERLEYEALLAFLLEQPGETLRCLVAYHVAELGLVSFRPQLQRIDPRQTGLFVNRVIERALRMLPEEGLAGG
ncbi:MAG: Npt1/Npt2 family nucleotide transporter [Vicinamibacteria bacterium]